MIESKANGITTISTNKVTPPSDKNNNNNRAPTVSLAPKIDKMCFDTIQQFQLLHSGNDTNPDETSATANTVDREDHTSNTKVKKAEILHAGRASRDDYNLIFSRSNLVDIIHFSVEN